MVVRTIIAPEYFGVAYYGHYYIPLCTCSSGSSILLIITMCSHIGLRKFGTVMWHNVSAADMLKFCVGFVKNTFLYVGQHLEMNKGHLQEIKGSQFLGGGEVFLFGPWIIDYRPANELMCCCKNS